ncbi:unnamed protein product [Zymoseptoria tritici ST99CH_3D7]|uniref:Uncharacterized protein n=2 Tax=Zymoseptoria tritici TaxID=1047171 RepID=A0A1X7RZF6_ZYMT9|nr:unnamed protein product [Zymoseptoria tritici ST99CH_3D7]
MRMPSMEFIYRLSCDMASENHAVGAPFSGSHNRVIMPIVGGRVEGPRVSADIQHMSGADWGTAIKGTNFMILNARYTLKTIDGHFIYVRSKGIFSPNRDDFFANRPPENVTQDDADWFTRLQFEASGSYNWLNGVLAIGVLAMCEKRIVIDAYRITNTPGVEAKSLHVE